MVSRYKVSKYSALLPYIQEQCAPVLQDRRQFFPKNTFKITATILLVRGPCEGEVSLPSED